MSEPTAQLAAQPIDRELQPGELVGEYTVDKKIGKGAFGTVFKAFHPVIGKLAAIKVLSRKFSVDPEMVARFVSEARAVNQIRHRNIVDIFAFGQLADGRHYYVMELLDGEPLDARLERERRLSLQDALPILRALARSLDAAHGKGIAHRDLKPENIFLVRDDDGGAFPKLLDFGIAKLLGPDESAKSLTQSGVFMGTPYFMSPEQCRGRNIDHRTDYYAFGVLAYLILTGEHPITGDDHMTILMGQITETPPPPSEKVPELPAAVDETIAWLMQKDPAHRPPNLLTAVRALEVAAAHGGVAVARATPSRTFDATTAEGRIPSEVGKRSTAIGDELPPQRSRAVLVIALAGALAAGIVAFGVVRARVGDPAREPTAAVAPIVATADAQVDVTSPPPSPDAASAPALITLTFTGAPARTEVLIDGERIGETPTVRLRRSERTTTLHLRRTGYQPTNIDVILDGDRTIAVTLKRTPARPPPPPRQPHDPRGIEDPFGRGGR